MSTDRLSNYYGHDHDELDDFLKGFQHFKRTDFARAKALFKSFKFGLQRHIIWEEEILFPVFETKTGMVDRGPTAVMRHEHVLIKEALEALHQKVRRQDPDCEEEEQVLIGILKSHNDKEEQILYPAIDQMTNAQEKERIFAQMNTVPEERYKSCGCGHAH